MKTFIEIGEERRGIAQVPLPSPPGNLPIVPPAVSPKEASTNDGKPPLRAERLAYSVQEAADLLGVNYFSVYRLIQRHKLRACRALRGKLLVPRAELLKLLLTE